jgi:hypothetical protein
MEQKSQVEASRFVGYPFIVRCYIDGWDLFDWCGCLNFDEALLQHALYVRYLCMSGGSGWASLCREHPDGQSDTVVHTDVDAGYLAR